MVPPTRPAGAAAAATGLTALQKLLSPLPLLAVVRPLSLALSHSFSVISGLKGLSRFVLDSEEEEGVASGHSMTPGAVGDLHDEGSGGRSRPSAAAVGDAGDSRGMGGSVTDSSLRNVVVGLA